MLYVRMFQASSKVWCTYFQSFSDEPANSVFERSDKFLNFAYNIFDLLELNPTHHLVSHLDRKSEYRSYSNVRLSKSIQSYSDRLMGIELANVEAPNKYHEWNLRVAEYENWNRSISVMIRSKYLKDEQFLEKIISQISDLGPWHRGFAFERKLTKAPEIFMLGTAFYDEKGISKNEKSLLKKWEIMPVKQRKEILRGLFPINLIDYEMKLKVSEIFANDELEVQEMSNSLFKFYVSKRNKKVVSRKLKEAGLLLS